MQQGHTEIKLIFNKGMYARIGQMEFQADVDKEIVKTGKEISDLTKKLTKANDEPAEKNLRKELKRMKQYKINLKSKRGLLPPDSFPFYRFANTTDVKNQIDAEIRALKVSKNRW